MRTQLLLSYLVLCAALMVSSGLYNRLALLFVVISFGLLVTAAWRYARGGAAVRESSFNMLLLFAVLISIGFWFVGPTSTDPHPAWYESFAQTAAGAALVAVPLGYSLRQRWPRLAQALWLAVGVLPIMLWFLLPRALPTPPIDVYSFHQSAAARLLEGINPYSVFLGTMTHYSEPSGYQYTPANLYPVALSVFLTGEVRSGQAFLMAAAAIFLWLVARRMHNATSAGLVTLLFLYHPRSIFVLDHSFTETIVIAPFALFVFLAAYRLLPSLAALTFGYFISLKPYLVFLPLPWLIIERRLRYLLLAAAGAFLPALPFFSSDFTNTVRHGFLFNILHAPFRRDSLTATSLFAEFCDCQVPLAGWSLLVGALATGLTMYFLGKRASLTSFLFAATIIMFSIFLFGSQAFGGYYYLLTVLLLFLIAASQSLRQKDVPDLPQV